MKDTKAEPQSSVSLSQRIKEENIKIDNVESNWF